MYKNCIKRVLDFIIALVLFVTLLPIFLIVAIMIKLEDHGPVIYKQERIGYKNKKFNVYKFRSMNVMSSNDELSVDQNSRITKVGAFIRKTSLDELPQLINIIRGEMSFIGPRPWHSELYPYYTEEQKKRHLVRPGITGYAQTSGRNEINILERIKYDLEYFEKVSFWFDIKICFLTIKIIFDSVINAVKHIDEKVEGQGDRVADLEMLKNQWKEPVKKENKKTVKPVKKTRKKELVAN